MKMLSTYTRTLTSWINTKNGTGEITRHELFTVLEYLETQHIPWVRWVQKQKSVHAFELLPAKYQGSEFIKYGGMAEEFYHSYKKKGKQSNTDLYKKFVKVFSPPEYKISAGEPSAEELQDLKGPVKL